MIFELSANTLVLLRSLKGGYFCNLKIRLQSGDTTVEQLLSSGCETPEFITNTHPLKSLFL